MRRVRRRRRAAPSPALSGIIRFSALLGLAFAGCQSVGPRSAVTGPALGSGGRNDPRHLDAPYVVLVSLDGFRYDYLDRFETPNLDRIARAGVRAEGLLPVFPVKTFPNHYSIATGMYVDRHGLVGNRFYEPAFDAYYSVGDRASVEDGRWYGGEPIWVTAETQGMVSASFFWVGSEAPVRGIQPSEWYRFDPSILYERRVDQVIEWLERPPETRPHLITLYFEETDSKGHDFAPDSPEMAVAVRRVDEMLGRLLDGIESLPFGDRVHVVVVSDHGMAPFASEQTYHVPDLVALGEDVELVEAGPHMLAYVDRDPQGVRALADELADAMPRVAVHVVAEMDERFRYADAGARGGDIVLVPDPGWSVLPWSAEVRPARDGWTHGWDHGTPEMQGLFVASGPRIRADMRIPAFENVHIYPLLAEILGLDPNTEIDGRLDVLGALLR